MKIAFFNLEKWEEEYLKKHLKSYKLTFFKKDIQKVPIKKFKNIDGIGVFINSDVNEKIINQLPKLKFIVTLSTGYDHIDLKSCKKNKIKVYNVPVYGADTVAEHTFGLILTISKKIYDSIHRTRHGNFSLAGMRGFDLRGKTIGIVGVGNIGANTAQIANGFDMNILGFDLHPDKKLTKKYGVKYVSIDKLFRESDIISLHVPLNPHTHHLVNKDTIKKMKEGVVIINTSRGEIIDTTALLWGLNKKIVSAAGLDVLEEECFIAEEKELLTKGFSPKCNYEVLLENHALLKHENVYITPHNAFNTQGALERILQTTVENIKSVKSKKKGNIVSK